MFKIPQWASILASIVSGWWSLMSGAISIPLAFLAIILGGKTGTWFAVLAFAALWAFAIKTAWKNYQLMEMLKPKFEINGINCELRGLCRQPCQFQIRNCADKTATNLEVKLMALESFHEVDNKSLFPPTFPVELMPESHTEQILINPGGEKALTLFDARFLEWKPTHPTVKYARVLDEQREANPLPASLSTRCFVLCSFRETTGQKANVFFEKNQNYPLKIKITAHDFAPTELHFNLKFTGDESKCRFTLISNS